MQEQVATKKAKQKKECKIFHEIAGNNYIVAQDEDFNCGTKNEINYLHTLL